MFEVCSFSSFSKNVPIFFSKPLLVCLISKLEFLESFACKYIEMPKNHGTKEIIFIGTVNLVMIADIV